MIDLPLVSIIVPFYNTRPQFMKEAIESVLRQEYQNWELFLVDDGSASDSTGVAGKYARAFPGKIAYLEHGNHQNRGASASRQLGAMHARGSYLAFLDADDVWLPSKLDRQVRILEQCPEAAMVYGNTEYWYSWTGDPADCERDHFPQLGAPAPQLFRPPTLLPLFLRGKAAVPCTCSVLVRRNAFEVTGGFEDSFPGMYDDQVLYAKICLEWSVFVSEECLDKYRQHPDSCCASALAQGRLHVSRLAYLNWLSGYVTERNVQEAEVWQALDRELWLCRRPSWLPLPEFSVDVVRGVKKWLLKVR